jgi:hypothetical protein
MPTTAVCIKKIQFIESGTSFAQIDDGRYEMDGGARKITLKSGEELKGCIRIPREVVEESGCFEIRIE